MSENLKFICDRMLGKLVTWLRIFGYDTLYAGDLEFEDENFGNSKIDEDRVLVNKFKDRILLTKDRELYRLAKKSGRAAILITSDQVLTQIKQLVATLGVKTEPVMNRCSVCNTVLRKPSKDEILEFMKKEGIKEDLEKKYDLWYCEKCKKLYWMGSHWKNMKRFIDELKKFRA